VQSERQVVVHPRTAGVVVELLVEEGDEVERGQVLARLDDREARIARDDARTALDEALEALPRLQLAVQEWESRLATAQQTADQAERDHQRNVAISQGEEGRPGLLSIKQLDESVLALATAKGEFDMARISREKAVLDHVAGERTVERARLALERAELDLSYNVITAPQAGVVTQRQVNVGDMLSPGAFDTAVSRAAFAIAHRDALEAIVYRPQRELQLFRAAVLGARGPVVEGDDGEPSLKQAPRGLELTARAEGLPDVVFDGWIDRVSPVVDPDSGNFNVHATLDPGVEPDRLLPGMLVRLRIVTERHPDALVVPKRAIVREGERSLVWLVRDGRVVEVDVREGFAEGDDVEIVATGAEEPLPGELVVVVGKDLETGDEVTYPEPGTEEGGARPAPGEQPGEQPGELAEIAEIDAIAEPEATEATGPEEGE
jgi:RND family efflux transporter MFP subunit